MDRKEIVSKLFQLEQNHYDKLNNVKKILDKENPVFSLIVDDLSDTIIKDIENLLLDVLGVSNEPNSCKYSTKENYYRQVLKDFIAAAINEPEYKDAAIDMISDWENLSEHTKPVQSSTWFYTKQALEYYAQLKSENVNIEQSEEKEEKEI